MFHGKFVVVEEVQPIAETQLVIVDVNVVDVNGADNSKDSKNTNLHKRTIHIHGGMEHNLAKYAKYYSCDP
jgi:hypothetical protein